MGRESYQHHGYNHENPYYSENNKQHQQQQQQENENHENFDNKYYEIPKKHK